MSGVLGSLKPKLCWLGLSASALGCRARHVAADCCPCVPLCSPSLSCPRVGRYLWGYFHLHSAILPSLVCPAAPDTVLLPPHGRCTPGAASPAHTGCPSSISISWARQQTIIPLLQTLLPLLHNLVSIAMASTPVLASLPAPVQPTVNPAWVGRFPVLV
jgi:hypothetical protein